MSNSYLPTLLDELSNFSSLQEMADHESITLMQPAQPPLQQRKVSPSDYLYHDTIKEQYEIQTRVSNSEICSIGNNT